METLQAIGASEAGSPIAESRAEQRGSFEREIIRSPVVRYDAWHDLPGPTPVGVSPKVIEGFNRAYGDMQQKVSAVRGRAWLGFAAVVAIPVLVMLLAPNLYVAGGILAFVALAAVLMGLASRFGTINRESDEALAALWPGVTWEAVRRQ